MDELIHEIVNKRDESLGLYHKSMKHEDKMYHSGWVAGLEYAIRLIQQRNKKSPTKEALPSGKIEKERSNEMAEMECDDCHNTFSVPIERANQIKEQKEANPKAKAVCRDCGNKHLMGLAMMQPKEDYGGEPDDYY